MAERIITLARLERMKPCAEQYTIVKLTVDRRAAMLALFEAQRTLGRGPAVWIGVSGGDVPDYHRRPGCGGGTYSMYSTERAVEVGYAPCRRCYR